MSSFIDTLEFDIMRGQPPRNLRERTEVWQTEGLDGSGAQTLGKNDGGEFKLETIFYAEDNADANDLIEACESLVGEIITITDDFGDAHEGCLIQSIDTNDAKKPCIFEDNADAIRVSIRWMCLKVS